MKNRFGKVLSDKHRLQWKKIFESSGTDSVGENSKKKGKIPVKLEVCSGNGDWVAAQAKAESGAAHWVACELKVQTLKTYTTSRAFK